MAANPLEMPRTGLHLEKSTNQGRTIVKCSGELRSDASGKLKDEVKALIPQSKSIVLDLTNLTYMDSSGLGALVALYVSCRNAHCELRLINLNKRIAELLRLTKLATIFEGYGEYL